MSKAIVLSIGYHHFVIPAKAGMAGKLIELLGEAVPCNRDYDFVKHGETFRIEPRRADVKVQIVGLDQVLPPKPEDMRGDDVVELNALPGVVRLLKGGRRG